MDISVWFFITSGLFLGWSLGANHAVNVFGTAVVSKMVKFRTAAIISGIFVILGSMISGAGTTKTLTDLGSINAIAGSFSVALAVGISVTLMTRAKLPVSTSQAVIGGIIGWNIFTGSPTDYNSLIKNIIQLDCFSGYCCNIWIFNFQAHKKTVLKWKIHLLRLDNYTRIGLIIVGALASYSLGANNIANVMGMFASAPLFKDLNIGNIIVISSVQQLFLLGGIAIAFGIFTYGNNVMETVGTDLYKISPITGFVVVFAEFIVLWLFTSQSLESFLLKNNLPSFPLVPLSTTQAFIGAVIGVGLAKDPLSINFKVLGKIGIGWVVAPLTAGLITFISLFFIQNVFEQKIIHPVPYQITESVIAKLNNEGIETEKLSDLLNERFTNNKAFLNELKKRYDYNSKHIYSIYKYALIDSFKIDSTLINDLPEDFQLTENQKVKLTELHGKSFSHKIDFEEEVFSSLPEWRLNGNKLEDKAIEEKKITIENLFRISNKNKTKSNNY
ncbi:MAG: inorganic phosphate transporter family protein [Ignavibacteriales bacterium]|nr:inorganic phosphate transporter family protein [Ignavibacteriales bacterium]